MLHLQDDSSRSLDESAPPTRVFSWQDVLRGCKAQVSPQLWASMRAHGAVATVILMERCDMGTLEHAVIAGEYGTVATFALAVKTYTCLQSLVWTA